MEKVQIIVECKLNPEKEVLLNKIGKIIHRLPIINSYVIEINKKDINELHGIIEIETLYNNAHFTVQMDKARKIVKADIANDKGYTGKDVTVAVLDTGIHPVEDLTTPRNRILGFKDIVNNRREPYDDNGHGTHVAGIIAGNAANSEGRYMGIAPEVNLVGVKILDKDGRGSASDVLIGLQWVMDNTERFNIRIVNLSIGSAENDKIDPLVKAVDTCWKKGLIVVIAAGNNGPDMGTVTSPGISRRVITVGAADDNNAVSIWGEPMENFSGRGPTFESISKPDIIAPGVKITSCLSPDNSFPKSNDTMIIEKKYVQLSGTSMATPIISGAISLLLQKNPELKPDDVKYLLKYSTIDLKQPMNQQGWGLIDIEKLLSQGVNHVR